MRRVDKYMFARMGALYEMMKFVVAVRGKELLLSFVARRAMGGGCGPFNRLIEGFCETVTVVALSEAASTEITQQSALSWT